jgi:hypothetical protein
MISSVFYPHETIGILNIDFNQNRMDNFAEFSLRAFTMALGLKLSTLSYMSRLKMVW